MKKFLRTIVFNLLLDYVNDYFFTLKLTNVLVLEIIFIDITPFNEI